MPSLPPKQPGVLEVLEFTPSDAPVAEIKEKNKKAVAVVSKAKGFAGVLFEGTLFEKPGQSMRVVQWTDLDSHIKGFNQGPGGKEYGAAIEGAVKGEYDVRHYQMYDPTPIDADIECVEFCEFPLKPGMKFADFYAEWAPLLLRVSAYDGCPYAALGQGIEDPQTVVQVQPWKTYDSHMIDFRQSPQVEQVMEPFHPVAAKYFAGGWGGAKSGHVILTKVGEAVLDK